MVKQAKLQDDNANFSPDQPPQTHGDFRVGEILSQSFRYLFENFTGYLLIGIMAYLPIITWVYLTPNGLAMLSGDSDDINWLWFMLTIVAGFIPYLVAYSAISLGVLAQENNRKISGVSMLLGSVPHIFPIIAVAFVSTILTVLGYLLLVIPGIVVSLALSVASPAVIIEGRDMTGALNRSLALTSGYRWQLFGISIIQGIIAMILSYAVEALSGIAFPDASSGFQDVVISIALLLETAVSIALGGVLAAVSFLKLRDIAEGKPSEEIVEVFS